MSDVATLEAALAEIRRRDGKYTERAYVFVLAALEYAQTKLPSRRHLSGVELAWACRDFALEQFGMLANSVLTHWGIHTTEDFGQIVFILIDVGLLARQPSDRLEDFERVYEFAEVFKAGAGYRWPGVSSSG
ncbi:MAG: Minf_1886 family protein [Gemmatimonadales bacterium]